MSSETITFENILKDNGYNITKARKTVFKLLLHPEPQSISQLLKKANGEVNRVSVYRSIELFERLGIVHRLQVGWKYKLELSDQFVGHHHHLTCLGCGKIIDIEDEKHIEDFIHEVADQFEFKLRRHQFEIDGYCKDCV